jgi:hypothetical protein
MCRFRLVKTTLASVLLSTSVAVTQTQPPQPQYVTTGIFIGSIEEGARIFTPVRLLPFGHPEALDHQFPTAQQLHGGEDQALLIIGAAAGLRLAATLQRYPTQPDSLWPYAPYQPPPVEQIRAAPVIKKPALASPLPGLRAVAYIHHYPISFIVDTRGLTLAERHMSQATTMGLDITRARFVEALTNASKFIGNRSEAILVFENDSRATRKKS